MTRSISGLLYRACRSYGGSVAVTCGQTALSFEQLGEEALAFASSLVGIGVGHGQRVGVSMRPSVDQVIAILGTVLADAVVVPILPRMKQSGIGHVIQDAEISLLISDPPRQAALSEAFPRVTVIPGLPSPRARSRSSETIHRAGGDDVAALLYSSGSTGLPKGIMVTHENIVLGAEIVAEYLGTSREDRIGGLLSLNFDYGLNQLWQALLTGASLHLQELVLPRSAFQMLASQRITALPLMPALVHRLFGTRIAAPSARPDFSFVRYVTSTGGPISGWALACLKEAFPSAQIYLMYGLTEAFRSSFLPPPCVDERPTSVGKAVPGVELYVVDDCGRECSPAEIGTLVHRGGCVAKGYWNDPAGTAAVFRQLHSFPGETVVWSNDLAVKDPEGYVYIVGRSDFLIKRDGYRIGPGEIEAVANAHPSVAEAVAIGLADGDRGQRIVLAWTARQGARRDGAALHAWLSERLPEHAVPDQALHLNALPVTANEGKFDRAETAALVARLTGYRGVKQECRPEAASIHTT